MIGASKYWLCIGLDAGGDRKISEIASAKTFFYQAFPELANSADVPDAQIQRQLLDRWRSPESAGQTEAFAAELCLRCVISSWIEGACIQLEVNFGSDRGFTRYDLFPLVLNDVISDRLIKQPNSYKSLGIEILQTFDPERSGSLSSWTFKLVKQQRDLRAFLIERGVYLVTDWAILNDTDPDQLQRIFKEFHQLSEVEIRQASLLLKSYHAVYRRDRRAAVKQGVTGQCKQPTTEQLQQIARQFHNKTNLMISAAEGMTRLQDMAELLREYRIYVRGGTVKTDSLDRPVGGDDSHLQLADQIPSTDSNDFDDAQTEFLQVYRQQFIESLDRSLEKVINNRLNFMQRQKSLMSDKFIPALHLFHCQGRSMAEIAGLIGLQAQYQVTRLLKLKEFRADVRQLMLKELLPGVLEKAMVYTNLESVKIIEKQVEGALDEQIASLVKEAEAETVLAKHRPLESLFARRLCRCLKAKNT